MKAWHGNMGSEDKGQRRLSWAGGLLAGLLALGFTGCGPPVANVLVGANGESIRLSTVDAIYLNPELTPEEKRQALRDLGITDESLIDVLLQ
ncbi:MAG TPA: hypothetical protein VLM89_05715 [Phycisphaerae bacterium]|nr:hypothetical protein [Phycisphaerae bacterium]